MGSSMMDQESRRYKGILARVAKNEWIDLTATPDWAVLSTLLACIVPETTTLSISSLNIFTTLVHRGSPNAYVAKEALTTTWPHSTAR